MRRLTIDWMDLRNRVLTEAENARSIAEAFPAIRTALTLLGDGHSRYLSASGDAIFVATRQCSAPAVPEPDVPADIGYVRVTGFSGTPTEALAFADRIQQAIEEQDEEGLSGWLVDLRGNSGGNMWPMIAGLGPIVGEGVLGYFVSPGENLPWGYGDDGAWLGSDTMQQVSRAYTPRMSEPRVAVLIDRRVASSGEATAIAFKARPATRFFGTATCGLSTANRAFTLSDGATLLLAVAVMADRNRNAYGDVIEPDEVIADPAATVDRAIAWLREGS